MMKNRDIVIVGLQPWDIEIGSNCKNIAMEFAKHNRVLYVNAPIDRKTFLRDREKPSVQKRIDIIKGAENLHEIAPNLWNLYPRGIINSINWVPFTGLFSLFNKANNKKFAQDIKEAIHRLGFKNVILFNDSDMFRSYFLNEMLKPDLSIYYSRDNLMVHKYWYKHGHILEPRLMARNALVVANSEHLARTAEQYNTNAFNVGQGCDISVFDSSRDYPIPEDLAALNRPIIGYIGAVLGHRLDISLIRAIAQQRPDWSLVFVGNLDADFSNSDLHSFSNIHFLGLKEEKLLPNYLQHFDVAFNPQSINDYTVANYPRKIDEYLALGKPTVATDTATMSIFKDVVYLGTSAADYVRLIEKAIKEDSPELRAKRIACAASHTWDQSVKAIYEAIYKVRPDLQP
ncbi:MAG: glycosyltransferase [Chitinophagaceae bacterium]